MSRPSNDKPPESDNDDIIIVELDEQQFSKEPLDPATRHAQKLASWRRNQEYMEKLKRYRPEEYEKIMKERAARGIKPPPELGQ